MPDSVRSESIHFFTIPVFIRALENTGKMLTKAEQHAKRQKIELSALLSARLYPDMFTLLQQLQYVCFLPVDFAQHFTSVTAPRVGYDETTFAELKASIRKTIAYLRGIKLKDFASGELQTLPLFFDSAKGLPAEAYAARVSVPDFFFHVTVAYAILRHNGVPLGKSDFFGALGAVPIRKRAS
jgi:hypothetical protein